MLLDGAGNLSKPSVCYRGCTPGAIVSPRSIYHIIRVLNSSNLKKRVTNKSNIKNFENFQKLCIGHWLVPIEPPPSPPYPLLALYLPPPHPIPIPALASLAVSYLSKYEAGCPMELPNRSSELKTRFQ